MHALLQGRVAACEHWAQVAAEAHDGDAEARTDVLLVALRREQERPAEAEVVLRGLLGRDPALLSARVAWASLLGDLGRDSETRRQLRALAIDDFADLRDDPGWLAAMCQLAPLAVLVEREADASALYRHLLPFAWRFAVEPEGGVCHGSVSLALGVLAHGLGRWDDAENHFQDALEAHRRAGAPLLVAHTQRQYAALLRARCRDDDWDGAIDRLSEAEAIYGRLGIYERAGEAQSVLARSQDPIVSEPASPNQWRPDDRAWLIRFADREVRVTHSKGLGDLAVLVANPAHSYHVADLWGHTGRGVGRAGIVGPASPARAGPLGPGLGRRPGALLPPLVKPPPPTIDAQTQAECRARLDELEKDEAEAAGRGDALAAALAGAERDAILREGIGVAGPERPDRAGDTGPERPDRAGDIADDPMAQVRRLVTFRIRRAIERIEQADPDLGRHLRYSVRTGTFCSYHPPAGTSWAS